MIKLDENSILMIEPKNKKSTFPVVDALTIEMEKELRKAKRGRRFKGFHTCSCGKKSGSSELYVRGKLTNSLAVHYLEWHRGDVPESELNKVRELLNG